MNNKTSLLTNVFEFLNSKTEYAILRNHKGLPKQNVSRDIDILIKRKEFYKVESKLINIVKDSGFKIFSIYRSDKLDTYVFARVSISKIDLVQFDFFFTSSIFGIQLLNVNDILRTKVNNGYIFHVLDEYEFLEKYLQLKFLNKPYPKKYRETEKKMSQSKLLPILLKKDLGISSLNNLKSMSHITFRRKIILNNLKKIPIKQIGHVFSFLYYYFKNFILIRGFGISFTGPDGSGKTTIIDLVVGQLQKVYTNLGKFHFRPHIFPNIGEVAKKTSLKRNIDKNFSNPHRGSKTNKLSSTIRLLYYSLDYIFGYFFRVRVFLHRRSLVIFDRYYSDIISDGRRSKIHLSRKFLNYWGKFFIPQMNYNFLITAESETIFSRKKELTKEAIDNINLNLKYLSQDSKYFLIENNSDLDDAIHKVLEIIVEKQHEKNLKQNLPLRK